MTRRHRAWPSPPSSPPSLALLTVLSLVGCLPAPRSTPPAAPPGEIAAGVTGEIDRTFASFGQIKNNMAIVVWSDLPAVRSSSGTTAGLARFTACHRDSASGRELHWQGRVDSRRGGTVTINATSYDLARGRLFLATVVAGKPVVEQLNYDIEHFDDQDLPLSLGGYLATQPEVRAFFQRKIAPNPPAKQP